MEDATRPAGPARAREEPGAGTTAPVRDLYLDLLRVVALAAVVLLHWLATVSWVSDGVVVDASVVDLEPWLWPASWVGDVMGLFFFVGGYVNWFGWQRAQAHDGPWGAFVVRRYRRLLVPTLAFLGLWLALDLLALALGHPDLSPLRHVTTRSTAPFGPLWFIGVYLVVIALVPLTVAAHRRWGAAVPVVMVAAVAVADVTAFALDSGSPLVANLVLVWLVPHQLGYLYADGPLRRLGAGGRCAIALGGLLALTLLTSLGPYPRSVVTPVWQVVIMGAPMLPQVASTFWMVGLALVLEPVARRWLRRPAPAHWVARATSAAMPVFLWHATAYLVALAVLVLVGQSWVVRGVPDAAWWSGRPVVVVLSAVALVALLWVLASTRRLSRRAVGDAARLRHRADAQERGRRTWSSTNDSSAAR